MSNKHRTATKSHLVNLMMHVIKWYSEPLLRGRSWINSINNARKEIAKLKKNHPSITDDVIKEIWDEAFKKAIKEAEQEMEVPVTKTSLTFDEVFKHPYTLTLLLIAALGFIFW